jgi:hypothetical protein
MDANINSIQHCCPYKEFCSNPKMRLQHLIKIEFKWSFRTCFQDRIHVLTFCSSRSSSKGHHSMAELRNIGQGRGKVWMSKNSKNSTVAKCCDIFHYLQIPLGVAKVVIFSSNKHNWWTVRKVTISKRYIKATTQQ